MNVGKSSISIVIPVYNEAGNLPALVEAIQEQLTGIIEYEIVVVNDNSPDKTWFTVCDLASRIGAVRGICLSRNFGKESALLAGIESSESDAVLVMDGDFQHPPRLLREFIKTWRETDADIIEGVKVHRGAESVVTKFGSKMFYWLLNKASSLDLSRSSDFKLINRRVVDEMLKMRERNFFFRGVSAWLGFHKVEIPFEVDERLDGQSKWSTFQLFRLAVIAITSFSSVPLGIINVIGGFFLLFAVLFTLYSLVLKFTGIALTGFTTVIILLLLIGSLILISLGIIGEYIARIYHEVKLRPRYIVKEKIY